MANCLNYYEFQKLCDEDENFLFKEIKMLFECIF